MRSADQVDNVPKMRIAASGSSEGPAVSETLFLLDEISLHSWPFSCHSPGAPGVA